MELSFVNLLRQVALFAHIVLFAFAFVAIARADIDLLRGRTNSGQMRAVGKYVSLLLVGLWMSGMLLIALDVGFDFSAIAAKPKLATKLTVVCLLTVNGVLLHSFAFPQLINGKRLTPSVTALCAVLGGVSSASWLFASFVGTARIIAPAMTYGRFMTLYIVLLVAAVVCALMAVQRARLGVATELLPS